MEKSGKSNVEEICLQEVLFELWKRRVVILVVTALFLILSVWYRLSTQDEWVAHIKYSMIDVSENLELTKILENYELITGESIKEKSKPENLIVLFNKLASQERTKFLFINSNEQLQSSFEYNEKDAKSIEETIRDWSKGIKITYPNPKINSEFEYTIQLRADSEEVARNMLSEYVAYVKNKLSSNLEKEINSRLSAISNNLKSSIEMKEKLARSDLLISLKQYKIALNIAKGAGITSPIENLKFEGKFRAELGEKAISSIIEELKLINDLMIMDPEINKERIKLNTLGKINFKVPTSTNFIYITSFPDIFVTNVSLSWILFSICGAFVGFILSVTLLMLKILLDLKRNF
ncbi:Wzz/FepE/Etk N-terminal domain-containing protein [Vibrio rotiferianus]|uniref:Wzz/FepE/Etk N-terminal domain-containing protein n=1 Tax=Vibrio rotiferianus TaxID=190895 RepID=UPI003908CA23